MKLVTAQEMQTIDRLATEKYGIPTILLMDQAAKAVADAALRKENFSDSSRGRIVLFCGKGNNGGDGFGAARYIANAGMQTEVFLVGAEPKELQGDAALEAELLVKAGVQIRSLLNKEALELAEVKCLHADVIVDAMLGTGFTGELTGIYREVCRMINGLDKVVVAVDIPTGVHADLGTRAEDAVWADMTVTMALPKTGLLLYPGKENAGELLVAGIGMPTQLLEDYSGKKYLLETDYVASLLPVRRPNAHKGEAGRVVIAAGSPGYVGAAAMSAQAAVKAGAGLVSLLTPLSCRDVLSVKLTEVMVHGLLERMPGILGSSAEGDILQWAAKSDVLALGPGLGTSESTAQAILNVLQKVEKPVIIDADALTALKGHMELLPRMKAPKVLTPHPGELAHITGVSVEVVDRERVTVAAHYAVEWKAVVVLKGAPTVVAFPDGTVYVNATGCSAMATGGSGDVLTGILAAFIAAGMEPGAAALAAVHLHGLAGELASGGEPGLAAGDIAEALPTVRKNLYKEDELQFPIYNSSLQVVK